MFVGPSLVRSLGGRSWKNLQESNFFLLQQKGQQQQQQQQQQASNIRKRRHVPEYRIITRSFPHYKVAHNDDLNVMQEAFDILHNNVLSEVEGKKTSKKILKQLKIWCEMEQNMSLPFDEDGYASDTSVTPEEGNSSNEMEEQNGEEYQISKNGKNEISSSSSSRKSGEILDERETLVQTPLREFTESDFGGESSSVDLTNHAEAGSSGRSPHSEGWLALGNYVTESMQSFFEGPPLDTTNSTAKNNANATNAKHSTQKTTSLMDIPLQFIDLLTYPDIDPTASKKGSFAVLREISFVKQRRKTLLALSVFLFIIRICSWDLFLVLLFGANCGMLFLMKNSGKVNVTMAKRAVRQRIGWAKQWAGSFLRKRGNSTNVTSNVTSNATVHNNPSTPTNNKTGGTIGKSATTTQTPSMSKTMTQDTIQSGSLSDTTHGGSVAPKFAPRRAGFFRKHSHQTVPTGNSKVTHAPSITSEISSLVSSTQNGSKISLASSTTSSATLIPTNGGTVSNQLNLTNPTPPLVENSTSPSTTSRRRFFKGRHHTITNGNNSVTTNPTTAPPIVYIINDNSNTTIGDGSLDLTDLLSTIPTSSLENSSNTQGEGSSSGITTLQAAKLNTIPTGNTQVIEPDFHDNETDEFKSKKGTSSSTSSWGMGHRKNLSTSNASISSYIVDKPDD